VGLRLGPRVLTVFLLSLPVWVPGQPGLPEACSAGCVTEYGQVLGVTPGGVEAYSNCDADCVISDPNTYEGTYTGIKWQCVEFARRWLLNNQGAVYGDVDVAADIWNEIDHLQRVADDTRVPLESYPNGSEKAPAVGDLLIYSREYLGTGHVAVVTEVDREAGTLRVAEQNFVNSPWPGHYARELALVKRDGRYWVLDAYLLGWKHPPD
jgi:hypothetical protein